MPMNLEFVFTAYGIWLVAFILYVPYLKLKLKKDQQAINDLNSKN